MCLIMHYKELTELEKKIGMIMHYEEFTELEKKIGWKDLYFEDLVKRQNKKLASIVGCFQQEKQFLEPLRLQQGGRCKQSSFIYFHQVHLISKVMQLTPAMLNLCNFE
eukprot:TRINITY_DN11114_c0_g1_i3.p5 TRINITY_DN11114_c0_g1~~TRINITY_DN11114_c0_g1_i3.p5  ORF type:complete len:108 (-),score=1.02 TRINITY_DN11114_c0_g1_i3:27-350(-)